MSRKTTRRPQADGAIRTPAGIETNETNIKFEQADHDTIKEVPDESGVNTTPLIASDKEGEVNSLFPFPIPISRDYAYYAEYPDDVGSTLVSILQTISSLYKAMSTLENDDSDGDIIVSYREQILDQIRISMEMIPISRLTPPHEYSLGITIIHMASMIPDLEISALYPHFRSLHTLLKDVEKLPISGSSLVPRFFDK